MIFNVIKNLFNSLDKAINVSRKNLSIFIKDKTFVNHTGDGFVAIFYGKGRCLQSLIVASLIANDVNIILEKYNSNANNELIKIPPLDYGIGIHKGKISKFDYHPEYPGNSSMVAFLGHGINLSNRVQESTKDHTFQIICTKYVYEEAISVIKQSYRKSINNYFTELGKHKLRGMKKPVTLYGVDIGFAEKIKPIMIIRTNENSEQKTGFKNA